MKNENYSSTEYSCLALQVGELLLASHRTCAVAESCTGGMVGAALSSVSGASGWFSGGIIAYSNVIKQMLLGVPAQILERFGAVSAETVKAMALGAAAATDADCAVSVSGVAGPTGGSAEKPVGLVYIGIICNGQTTAFRHLFKGNREAVREAAVTAALQHLLEGLGSNAPSPPK